MKTRDKSQKLYRGKYLYKYRSVQREGRILAAHRFVMEKHLGRRLSRDEHVHHIDHDGHNNAIENLMVLDAHDHAKLHGAEKKKPVPDEVCKAISAGEIHVSEAAKKLGMEETTLRRKLAKYWIPVPRNHPWSKSKETLRLALDMFFARAPIPEIVEKTGVSRGIIYKHARRDPRYDRKTLDLSAEKIDAIERMYIDGAKVREIADALKINHTTVCRTVKRLGIPKRKPRVNITP